jgi:hypothetical protein
MPKQGLFRAGRWTDVDTFPAPAQAISPRLFSAGPPLNDGYPRWEDAFGRFSTAKFSATPMAAIGRTLADYRRYEEGGSGILNIFKSFFTHGSEDDAEPVLVEAMIPESYFEDAHRLRLGYDSDLRFIDVEHQRTRNTLQEILEGPLQALGVTIDEGLSQNRDRRVTRLVMSTLHDICLADERRQVIGIRYRTPDPEWEAFVMWNPPSPAIDLAGADISPIFPDDDDLMEAAGSLGLQIP